MTKDQKTVFTGAASGILFMILSVWLLQRLLPPPLALTAADRLVYAVKWEALAAVPYFLML